MYPVRNSVKAIIIHENKLLCIKLEDKEGNFYILPGGGQEKYETFPETLKRECLEELGVNVKPIKIRYIREYIAKNHEFKNNDDNHQVEYMFDCELLNEPNMNNAIVMDKNQTGFEWIDLNDRNKKRVYPKVLIDRIKSNYQEIYWGDIN